MSQHWSAISVGEDEDWKIKTPAQLQFLGPSQSGKSYRILQLLAQQNRIFDKPFSTVIYAAPGLEPDTAGSKDVTYLAQLKEACKKGGINELLIAAAVPSASDIEKYRVENQDTAADHPVLLILDDLLCFPDLTGLSELSSLHAHHQNISCIYCLQNPFQRGRFDVTTLSRNCTGRLIFFQTNDWRLYSTLNGKLFPDCSGFLTNCLLAAKELGYNYVFVNTCSFCRLPRRYMCYTALFSEEKTDNPLKVRAEQPIFFDLLNPPLADGGGRGLKLHRIFASSSLSGPKKKEKHGRKKRGEKEEKEEEEEQEGEKK